MSNHGRQEVGGSSEATTRILSSGWSRCFRRSAGTEDLVVVGKVKVTTNLTPDVQRSDERRSCTRTRAPVKSVQSLLCRQTRHFARDCPNRGSRDANHSHLKRAFGSFAGMVHDQSTTLITKPGTPRAEVNVDGESL